MTNAFRLAVTTAVGLTAAVEAQAIALTAELQGSYFPRSGCSLAEIFAQTDADRLLIVGSDRLRLRDRASGIEYFFHPNMFLVRGSNLRRGVRDHFAEATGLQPGDSLLDCTLGFASEAALGSLLVGETGLVVGLESVPELAAVTRAGLQNFPMQARAMEAPMRRIQVVTADSRDYLRRCVPGAFTVVYFDPFFDERLSGSEPSVSPLFVFGNPAPLDVEAVMNALDIARRRVVIKHPRHIPLPEPLNGLVTVIVGSRKSRVVYSVIEHGARLLPQSGVQ